MKMWSNFILFPVGVIVVVFAAGCGPDTGITNARIEELESDLKSLEAALASGIEQVVVAEETSETSSAFLDDLSGRLTDLEAVAVRNSTEPGKVSFTVTGVAWQGVTTLDDLAEPNVDPTALSNGYQFSRPNVLDPQNPNVWGVSTFTFQPSAVTVRQDDEITLKTFIVSGEHHNSWIEGPDGERVLEPQDLQIGREYELEFVAEKPGIYRLICLQHSPTMNMVITVLPAGG